MDSFRQPWSQHSYINFIYLAEPIDEIQIDGLYIAKIQPDNQNCFIGLVNNALTGNNPVIETEEGKIFKEHGLKFHISLPEDDFDKRKIGWELVSAILRKEEIQAFKIIMPGKKMSEDPTQRGKDITVYVKLNTEKSLGDWKRILTAINQALIDGKIPPGYATVSTSKKPEERLKGSNYISYRYELENEPTWPDYDPIKAIEIEVIGKQPDIPQWRKESIAIVQAKSTTDLSNLFNPLEDTKQSGSTISINSSLRSSANDRVLNLIGKYGSDIKYLSGDIQVKRSEIECCISDHGQQYTSGMMNVLLLPLNNKKIKVYQAVTPETLQIHAEKIKSQTEEQLAFIPLIVAYDKKNSANKTWVSVIIDKKNGFLLYLDPAIQTRVPEQLIQLCPEYRKILNPIYFLVRQKDEKEKKHNKYKKDDEAENWIPHSGAYAVEIFKNISENNTCISGTFISNPEIPGSVSTKTVLSSISFGKLECIIDIRQFHVETVCKILTLNFGKHVGEISDNQDSSIISSPSNIESSQLRRIDRQPRDKDKRRTPNLTLSSDKRPDKVSREEKSKEYSEKIDYLDNLDYTTLSSALSNFSGQVQKSDIEHDKKDKYRNRSLTLSANKQQDKIAKEKFEKDHSETRDEPNVSLTSSPSDIKSPRIKRTDRHRSDKDKYRASSLTLSSDRRSDKDKLSKEKSMGGRSEIPDKLNISLTSSPSDIKSPRIRRTDRQLGDKDKYQTSSLMPSSDKSKDKKAKERIMRYRSESDIMKIESGIKSLPQNSKDTSSDEKKDTQDKKPDKKDDSAPSNNNTPGKL